LVYGEAFTTARLIGFSIISTTQKNICIRTTKKRIRTRVGSIAITFRNRSSNLHSHNPNI